MSATEAVSVGFIWTTKSISWRIWPSGFAIAIVPAAFSYFEHDTARTKLCSVDNQSRLEARSSGSLSFPCLGQRSSTRLLLDTGRRRSLHFVAVGHLALGFVGL